MPVSGILVPQNKTSTAMSGKTTPFRPCRVAATVHFAVPRAGAAALTVKTIRFGRCIGTSLS